MTGRVQKFSSNGVYLTSWQMPQTEKGKPKGMCRDREGNIVVVEPHYARVNHFSPEGRLSRNGELPGTNTGQLCFAACRRRRLARRHLWFANILWWTESRDSHLTGSTASWPLASLAEPSASSTARKALVWMTPIMFLWPIRAITAFKYSPGTGSFLRAYGHAGSGLGELSYPYDVQVDAAVFQFVAEFGNSRVQVFDHADAPVEVLGGTGAAPGQFSNPWSLALDSAGNLYVADSQNHRVQKFIRAVAVKRSPGASGAAAIGSSRKG